MIGTAISSRATQTVSGTPIGSGIPGSGPHGSPTVRETSHSNTSAVVPPAAALNSRRPERRTADPVSAIW